MSESSEYYHNLWENNASIEELEEELRETIHAYNDMYQSFESTKNSYERMRDSYYRMNLVEKYLFPPLIIFIMIAVLMVSILIGQLIIFGPTCRHCKQDIRNASPAITSEPPETIRNP